MPTISLDGWDWFHCWLGNCFCIQDIIHIGTKLRNRLLNPSVELPIGKHLLSVTHLHYLLQNVNEDKHLLSATDMNPKDRQNFQGLEKIIQPNVRDLLKQNVPDSNGTVLFLTLCDFIVSAFCDAKLKPLERVYKIWYSLFVFRGWWLFMKTSRNYNLRKNFITSNAFTCIELNAHSIVLIMIYLRKINKPEWFIPMLVGSQPCEEFFRKIRSFTSTYSTQVNFSMLEITQRIKKIQLQGDIIVSNKKNIKFPRLDPNLKSVSTYELQENKEIFDEIEKARKDAIATLNAADIKIQMTATKESELNVCGVNMMMIWSIMKKMMRRKKTPTSCAYRPLKIQKYELASVNAHIKMDIAKLVGFSGLFEKYAKFKIPSTLKIVLILCSYDPCVSFSGFNNNSGSNETGE